MSESPQDLNDRLGDLERRIASQETRHRAELAALHRRLGHRQRGGWARALAATLCALLLLAPMGAFAANFVDLNPNSGHNPNINAIADAGISKGCSDMTHYCPNDFVTREQMASFLARTAGLGGPPPVANAATAANATNAAALGGTPASGYLRPTGTITYQIAPANIVPEDANTKVLADRGIANITAATTGGHLVSLPLPVPSSIFGTSLRLDSVEICYSTTNAATFINTTLLMYLQEAGVLQAVGDTTDRTSTLPTCYTVTETATGPISGGPLVRLNLSFNNTGHQITLLRITTTLAPVP